MKGLSCRTTFIRVTQQAAGQPGLPVNIVARSVLYCIVIIIIIVTVHHFC